MLNLLESNDLPYLKPHIENYQGCTENNVKVGIILY